jgi:hypothetical protein
MNINATVYFALQYFALPRGSVPPPSKSFAFIGIRSAYRFPNDAK